MTTLIEDYSHTGASTGADLRLDFFWDYQRDIIDAPNFIPCGYHYSASPGDFTPGGPAAVHSIRPGAFR